MLVPVPRPKHFSDTYALMSEPGRLGRSDGFDKHLANPVNVHGVRDAFAVGRPREISRLAYVSLERVKLYDERSVLGGGIEPLPEV